MCAPSGEAVDKNLDCRTPQQYHVAGSTQSSIITPARAARAGDEVNARRKHANPARSTGNLTPLTIGETKMRRTLALLALLAVALVWSGCGSSGSSPNTTTPDKTNTTTSAPNMPPTTTSNSNSSPTNANSNRSASNSGPTSIKPPMRDEKK
jgi:hypothetical protein